MIIYGNCAVNSGAVVTQNSEHKSKEKLDMERGNFLLYQAFDEDEAGNLSEAKELYTEAVEVFLKIVCPGSFYHNRQLSIIFRF